MSLHGLSLPEWIARVQQILLGRGWTGDTACETAYGLAEIFEWRAITPEAAIARAEWCAQAIKLPRP